MDGFCVRNMHLRMWRHVLQELVQQGAFRTQRELVRALQARTGLKLNQATVSRELTALGARKVDGVYRLGPELDLASRILSFEVTAGGCLVVVKTVPAFASVVAQTVDFADLEGVLGSIAGDDTVFVATSGQEALPGLRAVLAGVAGGDGVT